MQGTDANTGKPLVGLAHLRQSITDILTTRIGSRVLNREYGSRLPELIDAPFNAQTKMDMYAATADALSRWEPRIRVDKVSASGGADGKITLNLNATYLPSGQKLTIDGIVIG